MIKILFEILFDVGINLKNAKIDEKYNNGKHNIIILDDVDYAYEYKLFWETLLNNPTTRIKNVSYVIGYTQLLLGTNNSSIEFNNLSR